MMRLSLFLMLAALLTLSLNGCAHRPPAPEGPLCFPALGYLDDEENLYDEEETDPEPIIACQYPDGRKKAFPFLGSQMICEPKDDYLKYLEWCGTCK